MSAPDFPIASVDIGDRSPKEAIDGFLRHREHERWMLWGNAPQSNEQLWTADSGRSKRTAKRWWLAALTPSSSIPREDASHFEAFSRAGVQDGQSSAWVVRLPDAAGEANDLGHLQPRAGEDTTFEADVESLMKALDGHKQWTTCPFL